MTTFIDWLLHAGRLHPDIVAILLGTCSGNVASLLAERYAIPAEMPERKQQGLTVLIAIVAAFALSFAVWGVLNPKDPAKLRAVVSLSASLISVIVYPAVARWATAKWPAIGTIWKAQ